MMVTFISECEKKALNRTRCVLDSFANRIGSQTWQTVITEEGLQAVKKLLRKTASKNTAVACHWIRSRSRSELVWIVGNRDKFNAQGIVPVNYTQKDTHYDDSKHNWHYLPLIKSLTALAALFHDWGKASSYFQSKLTSATSKGDPLRHEWVSVLLFNALVNQQKDEQWLENLAIGNIDEALLKKQLLSQNKTPLKNLPPAASLISWLIVAHHRLPLPDASVSSNLQNREPPPRFEHLLAIINAEYGYENRWQHQQVATAERQCLDFPHGLPQQSALWLAQAQKWATRLKQALPLLEQAINDGSWRVIVQHARLALVLGDHHYSSQTSVARWTSDYLPIANTYRTAIPAKKIKKHDPKQRLDQHLLGVMESALSTANLLPQFESALDAVHNSALKKRSSQKKYQWQDKAVDKLTQWQKTQTKAKKQSHQGFFVVNMASTGCGKTFANAKVMQALANDDLTLRYVLALGLRTLTLQTGDEYRERIGLDNSELAVLIGSKAMLDLHLQAKEQKPEQASDYEELGSESAESLLDEDIDYQCNIPETQLSTLLNTARDRKFLYAPVLVCTIDHLITATESKRGGQHILPSLRLMSSDLVIDELDDFDGEDLVAIARLCHLAGMLGRKVMISSATIPPDLAIGYFNAYQAGWTLFAKTRLDMSASISCAWIDEFNTQVTAISALDDYQTQHQTFVKKRLSNLAKQTAKRKAVIFPCGAIRYPADKQDVEQQYFADIQKAILQLHQHHQQTEPISQKQLSFGVVRMANIPPCIKLTRYLAQADWGEHTDIRIMAYHSQQLLLMRHVQEKHLDSVLKRNQKQQPHDNALIRQHINNSKARHLIFILVATPVEEVGRDHDFDWAVIEPSSYRSLIQLAGRVLRHRDLMPAHANIALMQYNLKALTQKPNQPAYCRPGYEDHKHLLNSHDLNDLLSANEINQRVDASLRIQKNSTLNPEQHLADLEHLCIAQLLTDYQQKKVASLQGWLTECWWLTALPQQLIRFRRSQPQKKLFFMPDEQKEELKFHEKDRKGEFLSTEKLYRISNHLETETELERLWLQRDYQQLLEEQAERENITLRDAAIKYGEINVPIKEEDDDKYSYFEQFGMMRL